MASFTIFHGSNTHPAAQITQILHLGCLLAGEQIETTWIQVEMTKQARTPDNLPPADDGFTLITTAELSVQLTGRRISLDMQRRVLDQTARLAGPTQPALIRVGDTIRLVPGSSAKAIITAVAHNL